MLEQIPVTAALKHAECRCTFTLQGAVANFVETEQLVELTPAQGRPGAVLSSFVQARPRISSWPGLHVLLNGFSQPRLRIQHPAG